MTPSAYKLEDFLAFLDSLHASGHKISTGRYLRVHSLLVGLAARGALPHDAERLKSHVTPLICTNPEERDSFHRLFDQWLAYSKPAEVSNTLHTEGGRSRRFGLTPKTIWLSASLLAVIALLTVYWLRTRPVVSPTPRYTLSGRVAEHGGQPVGGATVSVLDQTVVANSLGYFSLTYETRESRVPLLVEHEDYETLEVEMAAGDREVYAELNKLSAPEQHPNGRATPTEPSPTPQAVVASKPVQPPSDTERLRGFLADHFDAALAGVLFGPALLLTALWGFLTYRHRAELNKLRVTEFPDLDRVNLRRLSERLFKDSSLSGIVRELRRYRQFPVAELDVEQTVHATASRGGFFNEVKATRRALPEYLVLLEQASPDDQLSRLYKELLNRLTAADVSVDLYYFSADPRVCRPARKDAPHVGIEEIASRHPEHRLMVFADGSGFFNPHTGRPHAWLELFSAWERRTLLTPETPNNWGFRERALQAWGFTVVHASKGGMGSFVEALSRGALYEGGVGSLFLPTFPEMFEWASLRWLEERPPDDDEAESLEYELRRYLGRVNYQWLVACAVYPSLNWDVTLYFGEAFGLSEGQHYEESLQALVRLPWFRYGTMPDWLRQRLLSVLPPKNERIVRWMIEEFLLSLSKTETHAASAIVYIKPPEKRGGRLREKASLLLQRLKASAGKLLPSRRKLGSRRMSDLIPDEPRAKTPPAKPERKGWPFKDIIFASFISGIRPSRLALLLPEALRRLLFRAGVVSQELRPAATLVFALLIAGLVTAALLSLVIPRGDEPTVGYLAITGPTPVPIPGEPPPFTLSYSPTKGKPGDSNLRFSVTTSDCKQFSFMGGGLSAPQGSGISVRSVKAEACRLLASLSIDRQAQPGSLMMTVTNGGNEAIQFGFEISAAPTPKPTPSPTLESPPCEGITSLSQCPAEGCGPNIDADYNKAKNRTDHASGPTAVTLGYIKSLRSPSTWDKGSSRDTLKAIGEGRAVVATGYLSDARRSGPEACNCKLQGAENNDIHLNLLSSPDDPREDSVTAEMTPRVRPNGWTISSLKSLGPRVYVRVTGWLFLDTEHIGRNPLKRATNWEIHPVTGFEVCTTTKQECDSGNGWVKLESYSAAGPGLRFDAFGGDGHFVIGAFLPTFDKR